MSSIGTNWADGVWADGVWADGVWADGPVDIGAAAVWSYVLGNGMSAGQNLVEVHAMLRALHDVHGLTLGAPLTVTPTSRQAGSVEQTVEQAGDTVIVTRQ